MRASPRRAGALGAVEGLRLRVVKLLGVLLRRLLLRLHHVLPRTAAAAHSKGPAALRGLELGLPAHHRWIERVVGNVWLYGSRSLSAGSISLRHSRVARRRTSLHDDGGPHRHHGRAREHVRVHREGGGKEERHFQKEGCLWHRRTGTIQVTTKAMVIRHTDASLDGRRHVSKAGPLK